MTKGKNVLTTGDVAKICNVAPRTVSKWFDSGQLKGYRIPGSKDRRIPVNELMRFMKANHMPIDALAGTAIRVLLIDGDTQRVEQLVEQLRTKTDYDVQVAESNFQTGTFIHKFEPHVVLISLMDENIDAMDICKNIRDDEQLQVIKLIAVANRLSDSEATALLQKGFDGYVSDTTDLDEIIRTIEQTTSIIY